MEQNSIINRCLTHIDLYLRLMVMLDTPVLDHGLVSGLVTHPD
jgi:hypothetical protein